jgi:hypothetical protein
LTSQLFCDGPEGDLGLPELDGGPLGPRIKVFIDRRHDRKVLVQITKTTFFKYLFLMVKYHQNTTKYCLLGDKGGDNTEKKNQRDDVDCIGISL